jgi:hypothetical protein
VYVKKTKNPVAPLPKAHAQERSARATDDVAPMRRPTAVRSPAPQKLLKSAVIFIGLVCAGAAVATMGRARTLPSYAEVNARMSGAAVTINVADDQPSGGLPTLLSQRPAPTDESFRATGYARRK